MPQKVTPEQKKKAVQIAIDGGDPYEFLRECGSLNPAKIWGLIRAHMKEEDPETFAKIPDLRKNGAKKRNENKEEPKEDCVPITKTAKELIKASWKPESESVSPLLMARTPIDDTVHIAAQKVTKPVNYDGLDVCGVRGKFGTYTASIISGKHWIDFDDSSWDTLSYPVEDWKDFLEELRKAAAVLGVTL